MYWIYEEVTEDDLAAARLGDLPARSVPVRPPVGWTGICSVALVYLGSAMQNPSESDFKCSLIELYFTLSKEHWIKDQDKGGRNLLRCMKLASTYLEESCRTGDREKIINTALMHFNIIANCSTNGKYVRPVADTVQGLHACVGNLDINDLFVQMPVQLTQSVAQLNGWEYTVFFDSNYAGLWVSDVQKKRWKENSDYFMKRIGVSEADMIDSPTFDWCTARQNSQAAMMEEEARKNAKRWYQFWR